MEAWAGVQASKRLTRLVAVALLWALFLLGTLAYFQIYSHDKYRALADQQQQRVVELRAPRGVIFDRSGRPLALSLPAESVCVNPLRIPDRAVAAEILSGVLGLDRRELRERLDWAAANGRGFLWVGRKLSREQAERLRSLKLDWVEFRTESRRHYPNGPLAAHVIGSVDHEEKGNAGLEQSLDAALRGKPGWVRLITDVRQRGVESRGSAQPVPGANVTITLDERIQFVAERELSKAVLEHHAKTGSLVVMNPHTGEILAMASYPAFDPNEPPKVGEDPSIRFNHAVAVPFEPGSVFKVITLAAALETTRLTPDTLINCGGGRINLFGRVIREAKRGYGTLSVAEVLAKSSNVGAVQIGLRVGDQRMHEYVRRFGFGRRTGVPLPAESPGMVWDLKYWIRSSIGSVAMGHEVSTTTLQLALAGSVFANGGVLLKPRLVLNRQRPGGPGEAESAEPPRRILEPRTAIQMRQMMERVVLEGTGRAARLGGYTAGGKTGSAQIFDLATRRYTHRYNSSFLGIAPITNPAIVVAVTLNGASKFGGVVAAPVFRAVATEALRLIEVPKDLPEAAPEPPAPIPETLVADLASPPEVEVEDAGQPAPAPSPHVVGPRAPSFQGKTMRAVMQESLAMGVPVELVGTGVARTQVPAPGAVLSPGEKIRVEFAR